MRSLSRYSKNDNNVVHGPWKLFRTDNRDEDAVVLLSVLRVDGGSHSWGHQAACQ